MSGDLIRRPETPVDFEDRPEDHHPDEVGVSGSLFRDEEASVVISTLRAGDHHMDVDYARMVYRLLGHMISAAEKHNKKLRKAGKL